MPCVSATTMVALSHVVKTGIPYPGLEAIGARAQSVDDSFTAHAQNLACCSLVALLLANYLVAQGISTLNTEYSMTAIPFFPEKWVVLV